MGTAKGAMRVQLTDLKSLQVFMAVAESGGLSAAQGKLHCSLSQISAILNGFEKRFGVKLCERGRSGFALTEDGKRVYESSASILEKFSSLESELSSMHGSLTGCLRIATIGDIMHREFVLPQAIDRFLSRRDNHAEISLENANHERILSEVAAGHVHVGFGHFPVKQQGLIFYDSHKETVSLYCSRGHPLFRAAGASLSVEQIVHFDFVFRTATPADYFPALMRAIKPRAIASTQEARALLVLSGRFLGFLPDHFVAARVASGEMRRVCSESLTFEVNSEIVLRDIKAQPLLVRKFIEDYTMAALEAHVPVPRLKVSG